MYVRSLSQSEYLVGSSYYSSDSGSDTDEMAASIKSKTCSSTIHKKLATFFKTNEVPAGTFQETMKVFDAMYRADNNLWKAYDDAAKSYVKTGTLEERLKSAEKIGDAAVEIRKSVNMALSIITSFNAKVTLKDLNANEVENLEALLTLLHKKNGFIWWSSDCC